MNNYYDEIYLDIKTLLKNKEYLKAEMHIENELNMPYLPMDFEEKLLKLKEECHSCIKGNEFKMSDLEIEEYLKSDAYKQIVAVNYLDGLNLRDYLDLVNEFLIGDGSKEAKVLLVSSLINQDIGEEIKMVKDGLEISFIPRYVESPEITDGYQRADTFLKSIFENDNPSLYAMAKDLLIKECFLNLPFSYDEEEGLIIAKRITICLFECLDDKEAKQEFINKNVKENELQIIEQKKI